MHNINRNTNLDLLRIISMLMVVCLHAVNSGWLEEVGPQNLNWYTGNLLQAFSFQAVNLFVLISGFFLCTSKFRLSKLANIWVQAVFYSVTIYVILLLVPGTNVHFSGMELLNRCLVVTMYKYWYVTDYILLYCMVPLINNAIHAMNKRAHFLCCIILFVCYSLLPNVFFLKDYTRINDGFSLTWFCVLYILAAYIRLYVPPRIKYQKLMFPSFVFLSSSLVIYRMMANWITPYIFGEVQMANLFHKYNSIISVPCAVSLFQGFRGMREPGKALASTVRKISPLVFAVYLIHHHEDLRNLLWSIVNFNQLVYKPWLVIYLGICVSLIYIICMLIEYGRQYFFRTLGIESWITRKCDRIQAHIQKWLDS